VARSAGVRPAERSVRQTHQFIWPGGGRRKERKATGAGQANAKRGHVEARREYCLDFLPEGDRFVVRANPVAEDSEFVAADPRGRAASVYRLGEPIGDLPKNLVSGGMPMHVVDGLEAVQINKT
jgi:hypothetical protein